MFVWAMIIISYLVYRRRHPQHPHRLGVQDARWRVQAMLVFFAFVIWTLTTETETATALAWFRPWFVLLAVGWLVTAAPAGRPQLVSLPGRRVRQRLGRERQACNEIHARPKLEVRSSSSQCQQVNQVPAD